ncbi:DUF6318 family protein [Cellulomonas sp. P22]|uniref:DUF6318 family protein n=1 Tax=Cellulomonas sp. P22 TaxID=3373189 RepID=UPI0037AD1237
MVSTSRVPDAARTAPTTPRLAVAAALALTLVTGCTSSTDPSPSPTVTEAVATPTPTPTPTSTASPKPERPAAMNDVTVEGAIAAATYFISLYPYVYNTGDLTEWNTLSHPECIFCASVKDSVVEMQARGESQTGAATSVSASQGVEIDPTSYSVELDVTQGPWSVVDSSGVTVREDVQAHPYRMLLVVVHDEAVWRMRAVQYEATDD